MNEQPEKNTLLTYCRLCRRENLFVFKRYSNHKLVYRCSSCNIIEIVLHEEAYESRKA